MPRRLFKSSIRAFLKSKKSSSRRACVEDSSVEELPQSSLLSLAGSSRPESQIETVPKLTGLPTQPTLASNIATEDAFAYQPLDTSIDSIRLLYLQATNPAAQAVINCRLVHTNFKSKPIYEALSYTWGSENPAEFIFIDGAEFKVRRNLYWALYYLRQSRRRVLWIDAICIDQGSFEERQYQVGLMGHIYHLSQNVIVWLGNPGNLDEFPFRIIKRKEIHNYFTWLYDHQYWKRLWIIQEVGLSRRLTIHIGPNCYDWNDFIEYLRSENFDFKQRGLCIRQLDEKRKGRQGDSNRLETLLEDFQYAECKELRDRIYGFLGLAQDCDDDSILPDYMKPLYTLHEEVIRHFYRQRLHQDDASNKIDRAMHVVRFSKLVQKLLDYPGPTPLTEKPSPTSLIVVLGVTSGEVDVLGPFYSEIISSYSANKKWRSIISSYYQHVPSKVESIKRSYEAYFTLLNHPDSTFQEFRWISPQHMYSRAMLLGNSGSLGKILVERRLDFLERERTKLLMAPNLHVEEELDEDDDSSFLSEDSNIRPSLRFYSEYDVRREPYSGVKNLHFGEELDVDDIPSISHSKPDSDGPRLFLGPNETMGLVPGETEKGDIICQFWQTNITAVLRKDAKKDVYRVVGRAHLSTGYLKKDLSPAFLPWKEPLERADIMEIQLDIRALATLTC